MQAGVPMPCAHLLSNHYNLTRAEYYRQLDVAHRSGGDVVPFLQYAVRGLVDGLRDQVSWIRREQWAAAWRDYVHDQFLARRSAGDQRRLRLLLDLSGSDTPVPRAKLSEITPRVARDYATKTAKTLTRDINVLKGLGLIRVSTAGCEANLQLMLPLTPQRKAVADR